MQTLWTIACWLLAPYLLGVAAAGGLYLFIQTVRRGWRLDGQGLLDHRFLSLPVTHAILPACWPAYWGLGLPVWLLVRSL